MKQKTLSFKQMAEAVRQEPLNLPKYTAPLINLANQYAQGTRPRVVGQMSELIQEFPGDDLREWDRWYREKHPRAIEEATDRIWEMVRKLKNATEKITREMVRNWVEDLVLVKTFVGLHFQEAVLKVVADDRGQDYRLAAAPEESKGIDGYIGKIPVSIKPVSYRAKKPTVRESIECEIIYYQKTDRGIRIQFAEK